MVDPPDDKDGGKLITFPTGEVIDPEEVGADFVVRQTGDVPTPEIMDVVVIQKEVKERAEYVKNQELVKAIKEGSSTAQTIDLVLVEVAEELAHLKFERRKAAKEGKGTACYTVSRVNSLRSLAEMLLKRKEAALAERLDLKSPRFRKVFEVWMEFFQDAMNKCQIPDHLIDLVFQQMKADMQDWEKKMEVV